jgi:hypothetical protein
MNRRAFLACATLGVLGPRAVAAQPGKVYRVGHLAASAPSPENRVVSRPRRRGQGAIARRRSTASRVSSTSTRTSSAAGRGRASEPACPDHAET